MTDSDSWNRRVTFRCPKGLQQGVDEVVRNDPAINNRSALIRQALRNEVRRREKDMPSLGSQVDRLERLVDTLEIETLPAVEFDDVDESERTGVDTGPIP